MRVKCLAQEHNTWPGLEPGPLDPESSALTILCYTNNNAVLLYMYVFYAIIFRNVRLYINEKTLHLARRHVNQTKPSFECFFVGSISVDSSEYKEVH